MGLLAMIFGRAERAEAIANLEWVDYVRGPRRLLGPLGAPYHPVVLDTIEAESFNLRKNKGGIWEFTRTVAPLRGGEARHEVLTTRETLAEACADLQKHVDDERRFSWKTIWRVINDGAFHQADDDMSVGTVCLPAVRRALDHGKQGMVLQR